MTVTDEQSEWFTATFAALTDNVERAVLGKRHVVELAFTAMVSQGHLLLEDVPGTGKTSLARALAQTIKGTNTRIQFTPDLLPGDVTGITVFDQSKGSFEFHAGPVFANVVLADEINRASPKTQSALLEVMEEGSVTVDGVTRSAGSPFMVVATQNPVEQAGTYPLPEAQARPLHDAYVAGLPRPRCHVADPRRGPSREGHGAADRRAPDHRGHECAGEPGPHQPADPRLHRPHRRCDAFGHSGAPRRLGAWRARARAWLPRLGARPRPHLRHPR
ncbi:hypothetical protein GCM10025876_17610 [Demequina litorisediminis]|uniref:ATPase AAA-3 domain-containing protein n=1 Tax=Demequina litorisediminis TaxID=1849022 RepID=A0ABQ6IFN6_9MICO|nr:hypothetical protein GCM10025876_17610 [Demequina litorisediminis]